jgi:hypothetical protein
VYLTRINGGFATSNTNPNDFSRDITIFEPQFEDYLRSEGFKLIESKKVLSDCGVEVFHSMEFETFQDIKPQYMDKLLRHHSVWSKVRTRKQSLVEIWQESIR